MSHLRTGAPLTDRQREVLAAVAALMLGGGVPSMREVCSRLGISSTNGLADHYRSLIAKGVLERDPLKSRAMRVTDAGWRVLGLGVCSHCAGTGRVDARRERAQGAA